MDNQPDPINLEEQQKDDQKTGKNLRLSSNEPLHKQIPCKVGETEEEKIARLMQVPMFALLESLRIKNREKERLAKINDQKCKEINESEKLAKTSSDNKENKNEYEEENLVCHENKVSNIGVPKPNVKVEYQNEKNGINRYSKDKSQRKELSLKPVNRNNQISKDSNLNKSSLVINNKKHTLQETDSLESNNSKNCHMSRENILSEEVKSKVLDRKISENLEESTREQNLMIDTKVRKRFEELHLNNESVEEEKLEDKAKENERLEELQKFQEYQEKCKMNNPIYLLIEKLKAEKLEKKRLAELKLKEEAKEKERLEELQKFEEYQEKCKMNNPLYLCIQRIKSEKQEKERLKKIEEGKKLEEANRKYMLEERQKYDQEKVKKTKILQTNLSRNNLINTINNQAVKSTVNFKKPILIMAGKVNLPEKKCKKKVSFTLPAKMYHFKTEDPANVFSKVNNNQLHHNENGNQFKHAQGRKKQNQTAINDPALTLNFTVISPEKFKNLPKRNNKKVNKSNHRKQRMTRNFTKIEANQNRAEVPSSTSQFSKPGSTKLILVNKERLSSNVENILCQASTSTAADSNPDNIPIFNRNQPVYLHLSREEIFPDFTTTDNPKNPHYFPSFDECEKISRFKGKGLKNMVKNPAFTKSIPEPDFSLSEIADDLKDTEILEPDFSHNYEKVVTFNMSENEEDIDPVVFNHETIIFSEDTSVILLDDPKDRNQIVAGPVDVAFTMPAGGDLNSYLLNFLKQHPEKRGKWAVHSLITEG